MYGKIFDSMYEGTLYGQWEAIVTFQQFIVLCDADGVVDMTPPAISARTSIPLEIITKGIKTLSDPDPYSRTPGADGRRIELIDEHRPWGWVIVNHKKYQSLQDADTVRAQTRERVARHREKQKAVADGNGQVTEGNAQKRHTDTNTDTEKAFAQFWDSYPRKKSKGQAEKAFAKLTVDEQLLRQILSALEQAKTQPDWAKPEFIPYPATWLNAKGWLDEGLSSSVEVDA